MPPGTEVKPADRPRVILVDDHAGARESLRDLLRTDYDVVGAFADGKSVVDGAAALRPDVILLDIAMPDLNGFALARILRASVPSVPLLFVTQHAERVYVEEAFLSGGAGYVLKGKAVNE